MSASSNDKITQSMNGGNPEVATASTSRSIGDTSLSAVSLDNWPTATRVFFTTYKKTTAGLKDFNTVVSWWAIVSGTTLGTLTLVNGVDNGNAEGDYIEMGPTAGWAEGIYDFGTKEHSTNGAHTAITATSLAVAGAVTAASFNTTSANGINQAALPLGATVQTVTTSYNTFSTTSAIIPLDDTIPQITEGTEIMTATITPKSSTNKLTIDATVFGSCSAADFMSAALFQDTTANALAADNFNNTSGNTTATLPLSFSMVAGTTSATTFRLRVGVISGATTLYVNGRAAARLYGGVAACTLKVTEYKA